MNPETIMIAAGIMSIISISTAQLIIKLKKLTREIDKIKSLCDVFTRYDKHFVNIYEEININNRKFANNLTCNTQELTKLSELILQQIDRSQRDQKESLNNQSPKHTGWPKGKKRGPHLPGRKPRSKNKLKEIV